MAEQISEGWGLAGGEEYINNTQVEAPLYFRPEELTSQDISEEGAHEKNATLVVARKEERSLPPTEEIRAAAAGLLVFGFSGLKVNDHARRLIRMGMQTARWGLYDLSVL